MLRKLLFRHRRAQQLLIVLVTVYLMAWQVLRWAPIGIWNRFEIRTAGDPYAEMYAVDRGYQRAETNEDRDEDRLLGQTTDPDDKPLKTILFWTSFYENPDFYFGFGQQPFLTNDCPVSNCQTIRDKDKLNESNAVLFHGPRIEEFEPKPDHRPPGQVWVLFQTEPHYYPSVAYLPQYGGIFNYTMASKREADAFIAYGWVLPSQYGKKIRKDVVVDPRLKPKSVVWIVSHCDTHSRREWYVEELAKHIEVDVYGACGTLSCPIGDPCLERFEMEYKFYLALENSYCRDYVTEKMYRTMTYEIVPIVFGGANYTLDAPPHSVINILDYPHPRDLAAYLKYLSDNVTAYDEYFEWKRHYKIQHFRHRIFGQSFCKLCEDLNNPDFRYRNYSDIATWWLEDFCDADIIPRIRRQYGW
ncbi:hypothetical protein LSH36_8g07015 [Paralvinella palmiformis]|uniref:Fucosyltransferase n=1 Tax=Paralvinella palmiformis TaxID=53620 RepID=A0AAD9KDD6_9ANNE|nr:hypothetical protein LSH36_8g07015 [Paralvinella palmiformis]